ncbi:MAG: 3-oxoacyl-ACP reductase FabG [Bdellovibrionota bacterium]
MNHIQLHDNVAVVTGAAGGIGLETSKHLASLGASIAMVDLDKDALQQQIDQHPVLKEKAIAFDANVSKADQVESVVTSIHKQWNRVDILVNNAGILRDSTLLKMTPEQFDQVIAVNLRGVFLMGQACARIMSTQNRGKIINLSSVAYRGIYGQTNYSAAKAGVVGMTKTWALELSRFQINVNAIAPGLIDTAMTQTIPDTIKEKMIETVPLGRMGQPDEIAHLIAFLASDKSSYIQGEVISINGGFLI